MDSVGDGKYLMYLMLWIVLWKVFDVSHVVDRWKVFDVSHVVDSVGDGKYLMYLMLWIVLVMESISCCG